MRSVIAYTGTLLAAGLSSACCWIPLLLGSASVGVLGFGVKLEPLRPYLTGLTFVFLAAAFYFTYRPRQAEAACCEVSARHPKRLQKVALWLITLLALVSLATPFIAQHASQAPVPAVAPRSSTIRVVALKVNGMTCEGCSTDVVKALRHTEGVQAAKADLQAATVIVRYDEAVIPVSRVTLTVATILHLGSTPFSARLMLTLQKGDARKVAEALAQIDGVEKVEQEKARLLITFKRDARVRYAELENAAQKAGGTLAPVKEATEPSEGSVTHTGGGCCSIRR
jgi:mercuric ion transport protein